MNERQSDFALLREFVRQGDQPAFTTLARRHLDLVYATALRKVDDAGGAQEIAQNVFSALARKAWQFGPDDSLPAWLHKTTLLESKFWLRGEMRHRRREETAVELGTTMKTPEDQSAFKSLLPLLDDALLSLREKDRTALLLRYYETQSLRDVGAALTVSEDTARKRVQRALEKLAEFFSRRGFKTATVAATAAALQHTATSASATLVSAVVSGALQGAPPALVGLGALLARLASLTRVQTTAACLALVAVPVGWQLTERHTAYEVVKRMQTQLLATQGGLIAVQAEVDRLQANAGKLEQSVAQANEAATRAVESARTFEAWKKKTRGLVTAADYRWSDESPFVRIPKAALPELSKLSDAEPFSRPGIVKPYARELMGLTSAECQSLEETLHRHFADLEAARQAAVFETNQPSSGLFLAGTTFLIPPLPEDELKRSNDQLLAALRSALGEERWPLVQTKIDGINGGGLSRILNIDPKRSEKLEVKVATDEKGMLTWNCAGGDGKIVGSVNGALSMFLPEDDPNRTGGADGFCRGLVSEAILRRAAVWLQEQAVARLGKEAKP